MSLSRLARLPHLAHLSHLSRPAPLRALTTISHASPSATPEPEPIPSPSATPRPHHVVMSLSGQDRSGIVNAFTSAAAAHSANIEESKMAILGGDFAMIIYLTVPSPSTASNLATHIREQLPDFSVNIRATTPPKLVDASLTARRTMWKLSLEGPDQPGIVAALTEALAGHGCNVHELDTETVTAPFAGYDLFRLNGKVAVSDDQMELVSTALGKLEERFGADILLNQIVGEQ